MNVITVQNSPSPTGSNAPRGVFPLELLWEIVDWIDVGEGSGRTNTLLALRRTCFTLNEYATPFAFRHIRTQSTLQRFEKQVKSIEACSKLSQHVQKIEIDARSMIGCNDTRVIQGLFAASGGEDLTGSNYDTNGDVVASNLSRKHRQQYLTATFAHLLERFLCIFIDRSVVVSLRAESCSPHNPDPRDHEIETLEWFFDSISVIDIELSKVKRLQVSCAYIPAMRGLNYSRVFLTAKNFEFEQSISGGAPWPPVKKANDTELQWARGSDGYALFDESAHSRLAAIIQSMTYRKLEERVQEVRLKFRPDSPPRNFQPIYVPHPALYAQHPRLSLAPGSIPDHPGKSITILELENAIYEDDTLIGVLCYLKDLRMLWLTRVFLRANPGTMWRNVFAAIKNECSMLEEFHLACPRYLDAGSSHASSKGPCDCDTSDLATMPNASDLSSFNELRAAIVQINKQDGPDIDQPLESRCKAFSPNGSMAGGCGNGHAQELGDLYSGEISN